MGCLAFFTGFLVVTIIFLPPVAGRAVARFSERTFNARREGTLEVKEAWVGSVYGPQRIERVALRDPEGAEIFSARLEAPLLFDQVFRDETVFGPVDIQVPRVSLRIDASGRSNLERALALRADAANEASITRISLQAQDLEAVAFHLSVGRVDWRDQAGHELVVEGLECDGRLTQAGDVVQVEISAGRGRVVGFGVDGLTFHGKLEDVSTLLDPSRPDRWSGTLTTKEAPTLLAEWVTGAFGELVPIFGSDLERLEVSAAASDGRAGEWTLDQLELESTGARLSARGARLRRGEELAGEEALRLVLAPDSPWAMSVIPRLLPLVEVGTPDSDIETDLQSRYAPSLSLTRFVLPFSEERASLKGELELQPGHFPLRTHPAALDEGSTNVTAETPFSIELDGALLRYEHFLLPTDVGDLSVDGVFDWREDRYNIELVDDSTLKALKGSRAQPLIGPED